MEKHEKLKTQSILVTIAIANYGADHRAVGEIQLDNTYDIYDAVKVHRIVDAGAANGYYKIAIADDSGVVREPSHVSGWSTSKDDGSAPDARWNDLGEWDVRGAGKLQCIVILPAQNLASVVQVEFTVRLRKNLVRVA